MNTQPGYECYCKQGFYYDGNLLECVGECRRSQWPWDSDRETRTTTRLRAGSLHWRFSSPQTWTSAWTSPTAGTECVRTRAAATAVPVRPRPSTAPRSASV